MKKNTEALHKIHGKLIVSCQALENEPLHGSEIMARMAQAACLGGAAGIRANTVSDIQAIQKVVNLPIIGIIKRVFDDSEVYITPTTEEVAALYQTGVPIIAADFTNRPRPFGRTLDDFAKEVRNTYSQTLIMADISTFEEGVHAVELGADIVSTTLSGYTPYSPHIDGPDYPLIRHLSSTLKVPVIAEGRIHSAEMAKKALDCGAFAVVVGGAITRPLEITQRFVSVMSI